MLLILTCFLAATAAAPATYNQGQDGDFNVRADVQNVLFLVALPQKLPLSASLFDGLLKNSKQNTREPEFQERADVHLMEAFVEPSTPYHVEIGGSTGDRFSDGDGRAVEVVIAGKRRLETEQQNDKDELVLLGATENCGPEGERDPVTLRCRQRSPLQSTAEEEDAPPPTDNKVAEAVKSTPEVVPVSS